MQYFEYRKHSKNFGCSHCCCCGYCLCSGLCTANNILVYQYEYVQGHCLSKRKYRDSHEARMNVLSVEQYHTTYCRPGWYPACAQTKRSLAAPLRHRRLLLLVSCTLFYMFAPLLRRGIHVWRFTAVCQACYTIDYLCISLLGYYPSAMSIRGYLSR